MKLTCLRLTSHNYLATVDQWHLYANSGHQHGFACGPGPACDDLHSVDVQGSYATAAAAAADPDWGKEATGGWGYEDEGPAQAKQFKVGAFVVGYVVHKMVHKMVLEAHLRVGPQGRGPGAGQAFQGRVQWAQNDLQHAWHHLLLVSSCCSALRRFSPLVSHIICVAAVRCSCSSAAATDLI